MLKHLAASLVVVGAAFTLTFAQAPVASAQSVSEEQAAATPSIAELRWEGAMNFEGNAPAQWTLYFRSDGVLVYSYGGNSYDNGRWRQRDLLIVLDANDWFSGYVGHVRGDRIEGVMYNRRGVRGVLVCFTPLMPS